MALHYYDNYDSWLKACTKRKLEVVGRFKAFDRESHQYGFYLFNETENLERKGVLADHYSELKVEPSVIKLPYKKVSQIPAIWVMPNLDSSHLEHAAYDLPSEHMYLKFKNDERVYRYHEVPLNYWANFTMADSYGSFFGKTKNLLVDWAYVEFVGK